MITNPKLVDEKYIETDANALTRIFLIENVVKYLIFIGEHDKIIKTLKIISIFCPKITISASNRTQN